MHAQVPAPLPCSNPACPCLQKLCWVKNPAGWQELPGYPGLTSGLVTAVTLQGFIPSQTGPTVAVQAAPLKGAGGRTTWLSAPPGAQEGQCFVLPQSNALGDTINSVFNVSAEECCNACAADAGCNVWVHCGATDG